MPRPLTGIPAGVIIPLAVLTLRTSQLSASAVAAIAMLFVAGCAEPEQPRPQVALDIDRPNVILIVLDTLRADHLSAYGYQRQTSPELDAFAAKADRFSRCIASGSWSLPSHASMLTGKPAFQHGAHRIRDRIGAVVDLALHDDETTLAEIFSQEGYATGAIVANTGIVTSGYGFHQGFDTFEGHRVPGVELNPIVLDWVAGHAEEPFFLLVNYMDTHRYYNTAKRSGDLGLKVGADDPVSSLLLATLENRVPSPELIEALTNHYDTAIGNVDYALGQLFDVLKEWGLFDDTIIVVTSDHGELLGEHALAEHGRDVYQESLHVPLVVKGPGHRAGRVVDDLVGLSDIPSLILDHLPHDRFGAYTKLFPDRPGNHPIIAQNCYSFPILMANPAWGSRFQNIRTAIYEWPHKVIITSGGAEAEVYNLQLDPDESDDLAAMQSELIVRLRAQLNRYMDARGSPPVSRQIPVRPNAKAREELEALGYL